MTQLPCSLTRLLNVSRVIIGRYEYNDSGHSSPFHPGKGGVREYDQGEKSNEREGGAKKRKQLQGSDDEAVHM